MDLAVKPPARRPEDLPEDLQEGLPERLIAPEPQRFALRRLAGSTGRSFAEDVRRGLTADPKFLLAKYFYDELGSRLFEAITALPEYYVTRAETEILVAHAAEMAAAVAGPLRLVELGSGDARKTRLLIGALLAQQETLEYLPIDVSESALERSGEELAAEHPGLRVTGYVADYRDALAALAASPAPSFPAGAPDAEPARRARTLILFLGSTLGNLNPDDQLALFREVRAVLAPGDGFLLGTDLRKPLAELIPAYDDALGVTAAFDLNLLLRINRELGGDFDLAAFRHLARYDERDHRIEMHLESRVPQRVRIAALDLEIELAAGETLWTESSYKFSLEQVAHLGSESGFRLARTWTDAGRRFGSHLLLAI
jgi:L-histidine N-alpha-methyltransferase